MPGCGCVPFLCQCQCQCACACACVRPTGGRRRSDPIVCVRRKLSQSIHCTCLAPALVSRRRQGQTLPANAGLAPGSGGKWRLRPRSCSCSRRQATEQLLWNGRRPWRHKRVTSCQQQRQRQRPRRRPRRLREAALAVRLCAQMTTTHRQRGRCPSFPRCFALGQTPFSTN